MKAKYDYLIVGCGLFGSVFAREMTDRGKKCLVIDKRNHTGGNVYTENIDGINVHKYGAHIFHTNNKTIWEYVTKFISFNNYRHKVFVNYKEKIYSFPINLMTLNQIWDVTKPEQAIKKLEEVKIKNINLSSLEGWALNQVGKELYDIFIKGYSEKQWNKDPKNLPASIIKRIPIRNEFNDYYFNDIYQGIPIGGYSKLIEKLLLKIDVKLNTDYFKHKNELDKIAKKIVYTGKIDELFNYRFGMLEYRSLKFENEFIEKCDFQGTSVINFTEKKIPYTRIIEHKHFDYNNQIDTIITREFPQVYTKDNEPYYPINDVNNSKLYNKYKQLANKNRNIILGGRLAEYRYYDMHQVIGSALKKVRTELEKYRNIDDKSL